MQNLQQNIFSFNHKHCSIYISTINCTNIRPINVITKTKFHSSIQPSPVLIPSTLICCSVYTLARMVKGELHSYAVLFSVFYYKAINSIVMLSKSIHIRQKMKEFDNKWIVAVCRLKIWITLVIYTKNES